MNPTKQTILALSTVAAAIVLLACPLGATHQVLAQSRPINQCNVFDCDHNGAQPGNPHSFPQPPSFLPGDPVTGHGLEPGNPHNSGSPGCSGNPHGIIGTGTNIGTDVCPGSQ